jgi:hypothetical protein
MAFPVYQSSATSTTTVPGKPSGLVVGDLIILMLSAVAYVNNDSSVAAPDGTWTAIGTPVQSPTNSFGIWYKIATSTETGASTFGSMAGDKMCGSTVRINGTAAIPVLASHTGTPSGTSLSITGISPTIQCLLLNIVVSGNNNSGQASVSSQAVANSNPSWTTAGVVASGILGNMSCAVGLAYANETGAAGSATGNATATVSPSVSSLMAIVAISPAVPTPALFSSVFSILSFVVNNDFVNTLFSAVFTVLTSTVTTISGWTRQQKSTAPTWTTQTKDPL